MLSRYLVKCGAISWRKLPVRYIAHVYEAVGYPNQILRAKDRKKGRPILCLFAKIIAKNNHTQASISTFPLSVLNTYQPIVTFRYLNFGN